MPEAALNSISNRKWLHSSGIKGRSTPRQRSDSDSLDDSPTARLLAAPCSDRSIAGRENPSLGSAGMALLASEHESTHLIDRWTFSSTFPPSRDLAEPLQPEGTIIRLS